MTDTAVSTAPTLTAGTWAVEPMHSEVGFSVRHLGLSKVRGRFNTFSGTLTIGDDATASAVEATVDMASVDTNNPDRDAHLLSTDFFDAEAHPQMVFRSTSVTENALAGDLTINGITKPVTFDLEFHGVAVDGYETTRAGFSATARILRSDFGIDFNAPLGVDGMLIGDKVDIALEIQAVPSA
jgi:polyisoprenoid-binding protein YceI